MGKFIAYCIADNGVDGMEKTNIIYASKSEEDRDKAFEGNKNKAFLRKTEEIVDELKAKTEAESKLNGIDKLVLGLMPPSKVYRQRQPGVSYAQPIG